MKKLPQPMRGCVQFFCDRPNSGNSLLCDGYAFASCPHVTEAIGASLADKVESLGPVNGGFYIQTDVQVGAN